METTKTYTLAQLIELANTGACAVAQEQVNDRVCADKTDAAFFDPSKLKALACKKLRFQVRNLDENPLYLGFGAGFYTPGEDPLYPNSEFFGDRGVDSGDFQVGDANTPIGPLAGNALAAQAFLRRCPRTIIRSITIVNVAQNDSIVTSNVIVEKFNCGTGKCDDTRYDSLCPVCPTNGSTVSTYEYDLGLAAADERDAIGLLIPAAPVLPAVSPIYTIDVQVAFHEGAYGYVSGC